MTLGTKLKTMVDRDRSRSGSEWLVMKCPIITLTKSVIYSNTASFFNNSANILQMLLHNIHICRHHFANRTAFSGIT